MAQRFMHPRRQLSADRMDDDEDVPRISHICAELMKIDNYHQDGDLSPHPIANGGIINRQPLGRKKNAQERIYHGFPPSLLSFARMLPGNDRCPDCPLRGVTVSNNCLTWAK